MARQWNPKETLSYTYKSVDGSECTIRVGENGVTEEDIMMLRHYDHEEDLQDRYEEENLDYDYLNKVCAYERSGDLCDHPIERIPDERADIWKQLFPDPDTRKEKIASVRNAMEKLSADQIDLIFDLYGLQRVILDLGREKGVTEAAIRNRRNKILKRMKKLLDTEIC